MIAAATLQPILDRAGAGVLRYSLVFIFLSYGLLKFTPVEIAAVAPLTENSPFLFWLNPLVGSSVGSALIGVVEIITALLIALRRPWPYFSALGSSMAALSLCVTLSFLVTTPGLDPTSTDAGFLVKDLTLLGAALWTAGDALRASLTAREGSPGEPPLHRTI